MSQKRPSIDKVFKLIQKFCKQKKYENRMLICSKLEHEKIHLCLLKNCPKLEVKNNGTNI